MKTTMKAMASLMLITAALLIVGCKKEKMAEVETSQVTNATSSTATAGGMVTSDGNSAVVERGVCWGRESNPDISVNHLSAGAGIGSFTCEITGLASATTYYVRAYALNNVGISYGSQVAFTTLSSGGGGGNGGGNGGDDGGDNGGGDDGGQTVAPTGAINGLFSVSANKQVYFSQGNLQYQASTNTWRFAEDQMDIIAGSNANASSSYIGWIDLFAWGTSGYDHGAIHYQPWSWENYYNYGGGNTGYYAYGSYNYNLGDQTGQADWGYNAILNGGNTINTWRTLTKEEWNYLLFTRNTASGIRFVKAVINNMAGLIVMPDNWDSSTFNFSGINESGTGYVNTVSLTYWKDIIEKSGAMFLPAAGYKTQDSDGHMIIFMSYDSGLYWTASTDYTAVGDSKGAFNVGFSQYGVDIYQGIRCQGQSVRLVRDAN